MISILTSITSSPTSSSDGGVDGGADLVREGLQGGAVHRNKIDVHGDLRFADFHADARCVIGVADGVADGPEGA